MKKLIAINVVLFTMIVGLGFGLYTLYSSTPAKRAVIAGVQDKPIKLPYFGMDGLSHQDLQNKILVLNMFASWCIPCEAEHSLLVELKKKHGIPIYGIAISDEKDKTEAFIKRLGNPYEKYGHDTNGLFMEGMDLMGVPETFIIDGYSGVSIWRHRGPLTQDIIDGELLNTFHDAVAAYNTP